MKVTLIGSGDAFGSGGRLQTCIRIDSGGEAMLIDCGATALIGHRQMGLDPADVGTIVISHLHGDHFSGLVWWLMQAVHVARRTRPLVIAGPVGIEARVNLAVEVLFPGALRAELPFELRYVEQVAGRTETIGPAAVTPFAVSHPSGAASHALRIEIGGRTLAFSGDTEWVEALVACGRAADLLVCECYAFDKPSRYHMHWTKLEAELPRIGARRTVITHMGAAMLAAADVARRAGVIVGEDAMVLEV